MSAETVDPFVRYQVTHFYHFCDRRNLPLIRELGGLYSLEKLEEMGVTIPAPGGNDWSHDADRMKGLHQYVHLCLRNNHPMEYIARQEGRIQDSIFLQVSAAVLQMEGLKYTEDVSNKSGVVVRTIEEARDLIDFEVAYTRTDWKNAAVKQRLDNCEKCEILVPDFIPLDLIRNIPNG
jgi:hypothetical protein